MRVLVTGGSGFVGTRLVRALASSGEFSVRATYRRSRPPDCANVEWWSLQALDGEGCLNRLVAGHDAIVHLAGLAHQGGHSEERAADFMRVNAQGTRLLARAAAQCGVRRFVFLSSIAAVCTRSDIAVNDRTACSPTDAYGRSKLAAERALVAELQGTETQWCILRPPLVYGPGNPGNMQRLLQLIKSGVPLPLGAIHNRRSFMFVDNLVDAILSVLRSAHVLGCCHVLSDGSDFSTPALVRALAAGAGRPAWLLPVPVLLLTLLGRVADGTRALLGGSLGVDSTSVDRLVSSLPVDGAGFRQLFDWQPPVDVQWAVQQTGRSIRDESAPDGPSDSRP